MTHDTEDFINYGELIDDAMHIIVQRALEIISKDGLPGDHHFFISFLTDYPGVRISEQLRRKYPEEMTIVLQYQFQALEVRSDGFSVTLSFDNIEERLNIPFASLTAFADPSVKFGLQFRHVIEEEEEEAPLAEVRDFVSPEAEESNKKKGVRGKDDLPKKGSNTNVIALDSFRKK